MKFNNSFFFSVHNDSRYSQIAESFINDSVSTNNSYFLFKSYQYESDVIDLSGK